MSRTLRAGLSWIAACAVIAGGVALLAGSYAARPVRFLNALDEPVVVRIGSVEVNVPAGGREVARVPVGANDVEVLGADGRLLDHHPQYVSADAGVAVYNVLGAAPLYRATVIYASSTSRPDVVPEFTFFGGDRFAMANVEFALTEPPASIPMASRVGYTTRTRLDVLPGGWRTTLSVILRERGLAGVPALAHRLRRAMPREWGPFGWEVRAAELLDGPEAALALAEETVGVAGEAAWAHRSYLASAIVAGRLADARARYHALAAQDPGSALWAAMLVRAVPRGEVDAVVRAALAAHPDDPEVLQATAYATLRAGRYAEAAALYRRIPLRGPEENGFVEPMVSALILAGRAREATAVARAAAEVAGAGPDDMVLYLRASRLERGDADPEVLLRRWAGEDESAIAWVHAIVAQDPAPRAPAARQAPFDASLLEVTRAATSDPVRALEACRKADAGVISILPAEIANLLACEAYRVGDRESFERLRTNLPLGADEIAAWVDAGAEPENGWRLDRGERAALALARVRRLQAAGAAVPAALTAALRADPLEGAATLAARRWLPPERQAPPVRLVLVP